MPHRIIRRLTSTLGIGVLLTAFALPTVAHAAADAGGAGGGHAVPASDDGMPTADQLLAKLADCRQVSNGTFHSSNGQAQVPVCQSGSAYSWTSSLAVDCDGQGSDACNHGTDPWYQNDTAVHGSDGSPLNAATTPYVVLPARGSQIWSYASAGVKPGDVLAVIYNGKVEYAVFGDTGPKTRIGEASYATADALGINPDPRVGGADSGVTYILFPGTATGAPEDHDRTVAAGRAAAAALLAN